MYLMNYTPFYIQDQSILSDIKQILESVISTCHDIDIHLDEMIQTTKAFVDCYSNNSSSVTSNFDRDVVNASIFDADVVDDASSTTVPSTHVDTSGHNLFAGIHCNSEFVTCAAPNAIRHNPQQLLSSSMSNVKKQYHVDSLATDTQKAVLPSPVAQLEHFAKPKEAKATKLTSAITDSISMAQEVAVIGVFEEHSRICSFSSMPEPTLASVSGWPPPTQDSHCKYALLLHVSVTALGQFIGSAQCSSVANMDAPFTLLQYGPKAFAEAKVTVEHIDLQPARINGRVQRLTYNPIQCNIARASNQFILIWLNGFIEWFPSHPYFVVEPQRNNTWNYLEIATTLRDVFQTAVTFQLLVLQFFHVCDSNETASKRVEAWSSIHRKKETVAAFFVATFI